MLKITCFLVLFISNSVFIYSLQGFAGYLLGILVGILLKDANVAIQVVPLLITPLIMFGGLPVNLNTMADYASWMQYLDPVQYGYKALLLNQLNTDSL
jgi:ABC-type multidrug transport system permease subunit